MALFGLYRFKALGITSTKIPQNTHLWVESAAGNLYLVDSIDNTKIYKSLDKGAIQTQLDIDPGNAWGGDNKSRPKNIVALWYDRTNSKIYFLDSDKDGTDSHIFTMDLSDDTVIETLTIATSHAYDVFYDGASVWFSRKFDPAPNTNINF